MTRYSILLSGLYLAVCLVLLHANLAYATRMLGLLGVATVAVLFESFVQSSLSRSAIVAVLVVAILSASLELVGRERWSSEVGFVDPLPMILFASALLVGAAAKCGDYLACLPASGAAIAVLVSPMSDTGEFKVAPLVMFLALSALCVMAAWSDRLSGWQRPLAGVATITVSVVGTWAVSIPRMRSSGLAIPWLVDHIWPRILAPCLGAFLVLLAQETITKRRSAPAE